MDELRTATEPESSHQKPVQGGDFWRYSAELIKTLLVVSVLAYGIRVYVLQPFVVDGLSMYPGLHDKDYLLVDKLSYHLHQPTRGDVVVFKYPKDISFNYVKRIIAFPGERVKITDSIVTIYNAEHPNGFTLKEPYVSDGNKTLPNPATNQTDFTVQAGNYFVLGDNREGSSDSRDWGDLPESDMIGRVLVLAYPINRFELTPHATY
ncbi:MAG: signal peptidase I [bacterium]